MTLQLPTVVTLTEVLEHATRADKIGYNRLSAYVDLSTLAVSCGCLQISTISIILTSLFRKVLRWTRSTGQVGTSGSITIAVASLREHEMYDRQLRFNEKNCLPH